MKDAFGRRMRLSLLVVAVLVAVGAVVYGSSILLADDLEYPEQKDERDGPTLTSGVPRLPRPNEATSTDIDSAIEALGETPAFALVIEAVEQGDVERLLDAARQDNFCDRVWRASETPAECLTSTDVPGVYLEGSSTTPNVLPLESGRRWIRDVLAGGPLTLSLAARGSDGNTYLVFKPAGAGGGQGDFDGLGVVVNERESTPIQWFRLIMPANNGLDWLQIRAAEAEGNPRFDLIAPESVKDWPGLWGEKGE